MCVKVIECNLTKGECGNLIKGRRHGVGGFLKRGKHLKHEGLKMAEVMLNKNRVK